MKSIATAEAPSNLAFVKYWGKKDARLRLPTNNSISVNLGTALTRTTVEFDDALTNDVVSSSGSFQLPMEDASFSIRISQHLDRIRNLAGSQIKARVCTENSFPSGVGIASSASGFAALTLAACQALGMDLVEKELSRLARLGSGSACRSIPDGFCEWLAGTSDLDSYAVQVAPSDHWQLCILTVVVSRHPKQVSSTSGHELALASPFFPARLDTLPGRLKAIRSAILSKDFETFGRQTELEAISFHSIAMTSPNQTENGWHSGAYYWTPETLEVMLKVQQWRDQGLGVYFTLDAGPTVHLICLEGQLERLKTRVRELEANQPDRHWDLLVNRPAKGAHLVQDHLHMEGP